MQRSTVYFMWKLLYMFRVVPSTIMMMGDGTTRNMQSSFHIK